MFDIVDAVLSYDRELVVCSFRQDSSKAKGSSCNLSAMHIPRFYFVGQNGYTNDGMLYECICNNKTLSAYIKIKINKVKCQLLAGMIFVEIRE